MSPVAVSSTAQSGPNDKMEYETIDFNTKRIRYCPKHSQFCNVHTTSKKISGRCR